MKKVILLCLMFCACSGLYANVAYEFEYTASNVDKCMVDVTLIVRNSNPDVSIITDKCWGEYDICNHSSYTKPYVLDNTQWDFCWSQKSPSEVISDLKSIPDVKTTTRSTTISPVVIPSEPYRNADELFQTRHH